MDISTALSKAGEVKQRGDKWRARCPAHGGDGFNLEIRNDGGRAYFTCYSRGCGHEEIIKAMGESVPMPVASYSNGTPPPPDYPPMEGELVARPKPKKKEKTNWKEAARYDYTDENGGYLFHKVRLEDVDGIAPKSFRAKRGDDWSIGDARRVLYNLPAVIDSKRVFIVEGEKDVDRLGVMGLVATCNFDGASMPERVVNGKTIPAQKQKWLDAYNPFFADKVVCIIPDNDPQGVYHSQFVLDSISQFAKTAVIVRVDTGNIKGGDVSDWLELGNTKEDLIKLCEAEPVTDGGENSWSLLTLADAQEPLPPIEYVVDGIIAKASVNMFYGAPASFKSMIGGDMCMAVLSGENWLCFPNGRGGFETNYTPILWVDVDNGLRRSKERFGALSRAYNIDGEDNADFFFVSMPQPAFAADKITSILDLEYAIDKTGAGMVFIDNLGLITGDVEENGSGMAKVMGNIRGVAERTGAAIILIHHQRKSYGGKTRAGDSLRGHSSIEAALDLALQISREPNSSNVQVMSTKTRGVDVPLITGAYSFEHTEDSSDLYKARFWGLESVVSGTPIEIAILAVLNMHKAGLNQGDIIDEVKAIMDTPAGVNSIRGFVITMAKDGKISTTTGNNNATIYKQNQP